MVDFNLFIGSCETMENVKGKRGKEGTEPKCQVVFTYSMMVKWTVIKNNPVHSSLKSPKSKNYT